MSIFYMMSPEDADNHRAQHEAVAHDVKRLYQELPEEHLRTLGRLLEGIFAADDARNVAAYHAGRVSTYMETRFKSCSACGRNHDKELNEMGAEEVPGYVSARRKEEEVKWTEIDSNAPLKAREMELMEEYNLDDLREEGTFNLIGFVCLGCGKRYVSIQDRILRPPGVEGCDGCEHKAKFG